MTDEEKAAAEKAAARARLRGVIVKIGGDIALEELRGEQASTSRTGSDDLRRFRDQQPYAVARVIRSAVVRSTREQVSTAVLRDPEQTARSFVKSLRVMSWRYPTPSEDTNPSDRLVRESMALLDETFNRSTKRDRAELEPRWEDLTSAVQADHDPGVVGSVLTPLLLRDRSDDAVDRLAQAIQIADDKAHSDQLPLPPLESWVASFIAAGARLLRDLRSPR